MYVYTYMYTYIYAHIYTYIYAHMYVYIYIVVKTREISENKVLNNVNVELWQLKLHLHPHVVTPCLTYADDDVDLQI